MIRRIFAAAAAAMVISVLAAGTAMAGQWEKTDYNTWKYLKDDGKYAENEWVCHTDGKWYCFNPVGDMYTEIFTPDGYYVGADGAWIPAEEAGQSAKAYDKVLTDAKFGTPTVYATYSEDFWGNLAMDAELSYGEPIEPDLEKKAYILVSPDAQVTFHYTMINGEQYSYVTEYYSMRDWLTKRNSGSVRMLNFTQDENGVIKSFMDSDAG